MQLNASSITCESILEKYRLAIEHYERFTFAAFIQYECCIKTVSIYRRQGLFFDMEVFDVI